MCAKGVCVALTQNKRWSSWPVTVLRVMPLIWRPVHSNSGSLSAISRHIDQKDEMEETNNGGGRKRSLSNSFFYYYDPPAR